MCICAILLDLRQAQEPVTQGGVPRRCTDILVYTTNLTYIQIIIIGWVLMQNQTS